MVMEKKNNDYFAKVSRPWKWEQNGNEETDLIIPTIYKFKTVNHEQEGKVRKHMLGWHVSPMINVWTKYGWA